MANLHLTYEQIEARYPRLVTACTWVAILSRSEAACAIRDYRRGGEYLRWGGGEAVAHFGGPEHVIRRAVALRAAARAMRAGNTLLP
jgi:hypothetical protein